MSKMNRIKWIDGDSMTALIEAGAIGTQIEETLQRRGFCLGHEPDSHEFSSLGGWIGG
jgi:alkyldihydroxyacetonephosphate synthase